MCSLKFKTKNLIINEKPLLISSTYSSGTTVKKTTMKSKYSQFELKLKDQNGEIKNISFLTNVSPTECVESSEIKLKRSVVYSPYVFDKHQKEREEKYLKSRPPKFCVDSNHLTEEINNIYNYVCEREGMDLPLKPVNKTSIEINPKNEVVTDNSLIGKAYISEMMEDGYNSTCYEINPLNNGVANILQSQNLMLHARVELLSFVPSIGGEGIMLARLRLTSIIINSRSFNKHIRLSNLIESGKITRVDSLPSWYLKFLEEYKEIPRKENEKQIDDSNDSDFSD